MTEPHDPLSLPDRTLPQTEARTSSELATGSPTSGSPTAGSPTIGSPTSGSPASTHGMPTESTGTLAAPAGYDPSAIGQTTRPLAEPTAATVPGAIGMAGRYALLRPLAKGGMGQVSIAIDTELDREVALKEIQPRFSLDPGTLFRFTLEARVTGRLEHPGVVPVYGLGTYPDGRPYYAMRFITGRSFQQAINEFHEKDQQPRDPQERSLALRQLLRRFIDVCNTIAYAHSRGILHRDLKPANVMLGEYGETLVVDWGLAKELGKPSGRQPPVSSAAETIHYTPPSPDQLAETKEGFTLYGQTMGTPAFMSPEQAAGRWDVTGIASDVYSLGAMLYVLLSGTPPYSGPSFEVITRVQQGDYKPPRLVKGNVPAPLDAVVRKAMAFEIANRYPDARALAADVERWLADEPVSAYREPLLTRAARWTRRHRTAVAAAAALLVTASAALAVGLFVVNAERKRTLLAKIDAETSRSEARDALLSLTDDALSETLASTREPTPQQVKFLNSLILRYRNFAQREQNTQDAKLFVAGAWFRIGRMEARINRVEPAEEAYAQAIAIARHPDVATAQQARVIEGDALLYSGILDLQKGRPTAEQKLRDALTIYTQLATSDPSPTFRFRAAQCQDRLGVLCMIQQRLPEAEELFRNSLLIREALAQAEPDNFEYKFRVAQSSRQLADLSFKLGRVNEGQRFANQALAGAEQLVNHNPNSIAYLSLLADLQTFLTAMTATNPPPRPKGETPPMDKDAKSVQFARQAVRTWSRIAALNPADPLYRQRQAEANINLARLCEDSNLPREALAAIGAASSLLLELATEEPNNPVTQTMMLRAQVVQAGVMRLNRDRGALAQAQAAVQAAADRLTTLNTPEVRTLAGLAHLECVFNLLDQQKVAAAREELDAAWPHIAAGANALAIRRFAHAAAAWMDDAEQYAAAPAFAQPISNLPLPNGQAHYEAACLLGRTAVLLRQSEPGTTPEGEKLRYDLLVAAFHAAKNAIAAGFNRPDLLESEPDLQDLRASNEFPLLIEELKRKIAEAGTKEK